MQADESVFHQRVVVKKAWSPKHQNLQPLTMLKSEPAIAIVGAVSLRKGWVCHLIKRKSIKGVDFLEFMHQLRESMQGEFALVVDNASIHLMNVVKQFAADNRIRLVRNVPYHPEFQGIEEVWS